MKNMKMSIEIGAGCRADLAWPSHLPGKVEITIYSPSGARVRGVRFGWTAQSAHAAARRDSEIGHILHLARATPGCPPWHGGFVTLADAAKLDLRGFGGAP